MPERVILCIGTRKGLFVAQAPKTRRSFALRGPFSSGVAVYAALIDIRGTPRLYASSCNSFFGMKVLRSTDLGKSFQETKSAPAFPKEDGRALANIWSLEAGANRNDLWCGVEPVLLREGDRKSTRLNSSHDQISYAVFCLKKKKITYSHRNRH